MNDDLLARATRALRESTAPDLASEASVAATTLARVERSTRAARATRLRRHRYTRWLVMPVAASFLVLAAWASASGRLSRWASLGTHEDSEHASPATQSAPAPSALPPRPASLPSTSSSASEVPLLLPSSLPEATPRTPPTVKKAPVIDVDALYRDAHDAHFVRRDPQAALGAWDRYLTAAGPSGRFVLEARYNRAISLVRLGRRSEAAAALRPFASGEYGGYRRDEAAQLLQTLE